MRRLARAAGQCEDPMLEPEEFLPTLVEAEVTARDDSNVRTPL
jgi:hypothetical protein